MDRAITKPCPKEAVICLSLFLSLSYAKPSAIHLSDFKVVDPPGAPDPSRMLPDQFGEPLREAQQQSALVLARELRQLDVDHAHHGLARHESVEIAVVHPRETSSGIPSP